MVLCTCVIHAQDLTGKVSAKENKKSAAQALPGATVRWLNTGIGTITRKDGTFTLKRSPESNQLLVSFVGYKSDTIVVGVKTGSVDVVLLAEKQVQEITVEAPTQTISDAPVKTETIGKHQLERSACCSLAESFEKSPSVEVSFSDAATGAKTIQLLGLRGVYTSTMTDVIPMLRGLATPFGLDYVPGSFIENISISKGAGSVLNGYEGITGQINIEYKKPTMDVPFFVNAYANSSERLELNLTTAQQLSDNWWLGVMAHGGRMHSDADKNGDGFSDMPHYDNLNAMARLYHSGDDGTEFQLMTKAIIDNIEAGTTEDGVQAHTNHAFAVQTKAKRFEFYSKYAINPLFESPETFVGLQVAGVHHETQTLIGTRDYTGEQDMLYSKLIFTAGFSDEFHLAYGLSILYDKYHETFDPIKPRDSVYHYSRKELVPGAFAEATLSPNDYWTIVAGLRADNHNLYGSFITPRLHIKYAPNDDFALRASAGNGLRVANALSDNLSALVNQRSVFIANNLAPEKAWNYGISGTATLHLFNTDFTLDAEVFRTEFSNQVVVDLDRGPQQVSITNLAGQSFSNSALVQVQCTPVDRLDLSLAYRLIDAKTTTNGLLQERPLISPHRVLGTIGYSTERNVWQFDATLIWNSGGRIPSTQSNPESYQMPTRFDPYIRANAQVTRRFEHLDLYAGVENITDFIQKNAVISALDPHSDYFDASLVWGPLESRFFYIGLRWRIEH